jgi:hypothetical protein
MPRVLCKKTGLTIQTAPRQTIWRIAKSSFGPLKPPWRSPPTVNRSDWGRYDVADHRTVYGASPLQACYAECLAALRPKFTMSSGPKLSELFPETDPLSDEMLLDTIKMEFEERQHMGVGKCPAGWRLERLIYRLQLPQHGWFINIETAQSIAAISANISEELAAYGVKALTVADLRGENRQVTTHIAEWLWHQTLWDGTLPHGIRFGSKYDSNWSCWATWLRAVDNGQSFNDEPTTADGGEEIKNPEHNEPLDTIATLFRIKVF